MTNLSNFLNGSYVGFVGSIGFTGSTGFVGSQGTAGFVGSAGPTTIPQTAQTTSYTLQASDVGKHISITTGGVTIPTAVFAIGDAISIYNDSASNQTITQGASTTVYLGGTATTGNRTLAQRGICTVLCVGTNIFVIAGAGLT